MNTTIIAGTVGKNAELRQTQSGDAILNFTVAVDNGKDRDGNKRDATWFDCSVWGPRANSLQPYISKGAKLVLSGRVGAREYNGKAYLQLNVREINFMGGCKQSNNNDYNQSPHPQAQAQGGIMDDEIPF